MRPAGAGRPRPGRLATLWTTLGLALSLLLSPAADAAPPRLALIIDDLGPNPVAGGRTAALPGPVACSVLPHTAHARELAEACHRVGKAVLLHLPMEALQGNQALGPGALRLHMTRAELLRTVEQDLAAVPHVSGVNNHMGSLLTRHPGHMLWVMEALRRRGGLFFVDSRTTARSVAWRLAREQGLPALSRDVFLDDDPSPEAVAAQFRRWLALARRRGRALAIGHPRPATLALLERELPRLRERGLVLVDPRELLEGGPPEGASPALRLVRRPQPIPPLP